MPAKCGLTTQIVLGSVIFVAESNRSLEMGLVLPLVKFDMVG
ncbi:hypothetical protein ROA7450_03408 [Roseovarius albus]|uniref:Uncharacterized protein n=1 Tax=Roseovarius albus TaxID=1247867 RepID=A0A1X6ZXF1_9RHOB|nr:hypothetical protein ROA7450_03408 [Roseovarius albus]